ncbi:hypothetical protein SAMN05216552_105524 [Pseudoduganella namucuonensis]|uniref:Uncharacterized protein n=2 Tax=Pseudoduganella namucuonensis TaxID=1035707 RepID=A0A1I7M4R0_9BURK|nr:hypothetical protein SAMN05216552_105524 [Pseudoduganella namucuonensis]
MRRWQCIIIESPMKQDFPKQNSSSVTARIVAGIDVLVARVVVNDDVLVVRADEVGRALLTLHGAPAPGLVVNAKIEYLSMLTEEFDALPAFR